MDHRVHANIIDYRLGLWSAGCFIGQLFAHRQQSVLLLTFHLVDAGDSHDELAMIVVISVVSSLHPFC